MATWPVTLPTTPLQDGYSETLPNNIIRTQMDKGPAKVRKRMTSNVRPISCAFVLTTAQLAIFESFFITDCAYGAIHFDWAHPRTGSTLDFRFTDQPKYEPMSGTDWYVTFNLEQLP